MVTAKIKLTLHGSVLDKPILHEASRLFNVPSIIRYANIGPYTGQLVMEMTGDSLDIDAARSWFADQGVIVELLDQTEA